MLYSVPIFLETDHSLCEWLKTLPEYTIGQDNFNLSTGKKD
jgi:hypothetical protein